MFNLTMSIKVSVGELPEGHSSSIFYDKMVLIMNIVT